LTVVVDMLRRVFCSSQISAAAVYRCHGQTCNFWCQLPDDVVYQKLLKSSSLFQSVNESN